MVSFYLLSVVFLKNVFHIFDECLWTYQPGTIHFFFHSQVKHISFLDNEKRSKPTHENNKKSKIWNNIELASGESESWRKLKLWSLDNHAHWSYFQAPLFYLLVICVSSSLFTDEKSDCVFTLGQNHQYIRCESQANACNRHILRIHLIVICVDQQ